MIKEAYLARLHVKTCLPSAYDNIIDRKKNIGNHHNHETHPVQNVE
jgi:hypothetical protein